MEHLKSAFGMQEHLFSESRGKRVPLRAQLLLLLPGSCWLGGLQEPLRHRVERPSVEPWQPGAIWASVSGLKTGL